MTTIFTPPARPSHQTLQTAYQDYRQELLAAKAADIAKPGRAGWALAHLDATDQQTLTDAKYYHSIHRANHILEQALFNPRTYYQSFSANRLAKINTKVGTLLTQLEASANPVNSFFDLTKRQRRDIASIAADPSASNYTAALNFINQV